MRWTLAVVLATAAAYPSWPRPSELSTHSVIQSNTSSRLSLVPGKHPNAHAWGSFTDLVQTTGWSVLDVHSNPDLPGPDQSYAVGFVEGALTAHTIWMHFQNIWELNFPAGTLPHAPTAVQRFVEENMAWMRSNAGQPQLDTSSTAYWAHVGFLLNQLEGMTAGFNRYRPSGAPELTNEQMMLLSLIDGDMGDVQSSLQAVPRDPGMSHCSAMVALSPERDELWVGHVNWDSYVTMLRMVKYVEMHLPHAKAARVSMDSYPGNLYSETDFYRTSAGLTVTETSIDVLNSSLFSLVHPQSMLSWARAMLANRLSDTAADWIATQLKYNSGTCNNQWIAVDFKRFTPGKPVPEGTLWISETMPGNYASEDISNVLNSEDRSWFSYNVPVFKSISAVGGYDTNTNPELNLTSCSRARMYRRALTRGTVHDLSSFVGFMRYVNLTDPISNGDGCKAISARCDLSNPNQAFGAQDVKVASSEYSRDGVGFFGTLSPSWDKHANAPFAWAAVNQTRFPRRTHQGHPEVFNFTMYAFPNELARV
eukprot:TRINITY_DN18880_c0_g1_i1.p1 TRINITY_DN18880_c0_g1~~TRINITY_DN18880_c0_g1_i1.p1  ORF type:complete len:537 (+),score=49.71 TRINITY_DN18880_c0_g1_i1:73-1683(+)